MGGGGALICTLSGFQFGNVKNSITVFESVESGGAPASIK